MKFTKIVKRRRQPEEIPTARVAIRNHCCECVSWVLSEVEKCTAPECWLYPWRLGKTPPELISAASQETGRRLGAARAAKVSGLMPKA